ncbi:MAG: hypothetical protein M9916_06070 [Crocinitomicaceae bacterium]|nr:hypothetical protein [Crocinitomicaceae bacterium]
MKYTLLIFFLGLLYSSFAQIGTDEWRIHSENRNAKDIAAMGSSVFSAFDATLLEYDVDHNEISTWDVTNGLSDIKLEKLGEHTSSGSIFIGYENGNIDQIKKGQIINIPGLKLAPILGSKTIYSIKSKGGYTYFATGMGILKINPNKSEISETFYPGGGYEEIIDIAFKGDSIFALTKNRLYVSSLLNPAIADSSQWKEDMRLPIISDPQYHYKNIEYWNDSLYFLKKTDGWGLDSVFVSRPTGPAQLIDLNVWGEINSLVVKDNFLTMNGSGIHVQFNPDLSYRFFYQKYSTNEDVQLNNMVLFKGLNYFADADLGLVKRNVDGSCEKISFSGSYRNTYYSMDWNKGVMAITPGTLTGNNYATYTQPGLMLFEKEKWSYVGLGGNPKLSINKTWDIVSVAVNPSNENKIALGGACTTPVLLVDKNTATVTDTFGLYNSTLEGSNRVVISSLTYDDEENLWLLNSSSTKPLKLMTKSGDWYEFSLGAMASNKSTRKLYCDYNGTIWASIFNTGLVGYKPGSSVTSSSDDKTLFLNTGDYTGKLPSNIVTAMIMDFDNRLWIGTDSGFGILYNPEEAFDAGAGNYNIQRPKISVNGEVDYILGSLYINDIEVDGGNRKWIATANSGMILLSADGLTIIKHFTTDNSPLISNNILDLEIDHKTGEVFIVTDRGLMSYRGDATYEDEKYSDVKIFPNPARPDFDGLITIQGIRYDSDVKITDVAGNLVYKTTSNGGTATWNGKTVSGEKVASGVYLIWTASNIHKGRYVGKVVVVN